MSYARSLITSFLTYANYLKSVVIALKSPSYGRLYQVRLNTHRKNLASPVGRASRLSYGRGGQAGRPSYAELDFFWGIQTDMILQFFFGYFEREDSMKFPYTRAPHTPHPSQNPCL
ncbi:MAG: hypothetical protein F6J93_16185 [Oscillatoria sp. SIO1A7]|nr:hypothetical protein [Oscillatoria sp. SIO1A7]